MKRKDGFYWLRLEHSHNKGAWDIAEYISGDWYIGDEHWIEDRIQEINENRLTPPNESKTLKGYSFPLRQDVLPVANTTEIPKHRLIEFDKDNKDIHE